MTEPKTERLQKVLARAGIASRRNAEILILEGAVTVNGHTVTELGTKVDPAKDKIKVRGKMIYTEIEQLYVAFYKPRGVISALSDPEGRAHIGEYLKGIPARVTPIGRLDFNSEGLILLTNDGELAERIFKSRDLPKTYMIKVKGHPSPEDLGFLKKGFFTREGVLRFLSYGVDKALRSKSWLKLQVAEGSKLDIRELFNRKGLMVDGIIRSGIGHIGLKDMEPGEFRFLTKKDFERLVSPKPAPQVARRRNRGVDDLRRPEKRAEKVPPVQPRARPSRAD
ncbi:MAG: rRNA pseudouridine synthase [Deltaproteobacteria bacterium]|nr:rRNA pseudouridine synthase [Deltaproteobacteria bacterium]